MSRHSNTDPRRTAPALPTRSVRRLVLVIGFGVVASGVYALREMGDESLGDPRVLARERPLSMAVVPVRVAPSADLSERPLQGDDRLVDREGLGSQDRLPVPPKDSPSSDLQRLEEQVTLPTTTPPQVLGPRTGWTEEHFPGGALRGHGELVDGMRHGSWSEYWETGRQASLGEYQLDRRRGPWHFWHEDGEIHSTGTYVESRRDGRWVSWHPNGQRQREGVYRDGRREGLWREWYSNGQIKEAGHYEAGRREGHWQFFHFDGSRDLRTGLYREGRKVR